MNYRPYIPNVDATRLKRATVRVVLLLAALLAETSLFIDGWGGRAGVTEGGLAPNGAGALAVGGCDKGGEPGRSSGLGEGRMVGGTAVTTGGGAINEEEGPVASAGAGVVGGEADGGGKNGGIAGRSVENAEHASELTGWPITLPYLLVSMEPAGHWLTSVYESQHSGAMGVTVGPA